MFLARRAQPPAARGSMRRDVMIVLPATEEAAERVAEEMARINFDTAPEPAREPQGLAHLTPAARRQVALARLVLSVGGEVLVCEWRASTVMRDFKVSAQVAFRALELYPEALTREAEWRLESLLEEIASA